MLRLLVILSGILALFAGSANAAELDGTAWQLVKIQSMDDTVLMPDDSARYTLEFQTGGRAAIRAGCNRGTSSWTSISGGQLRFGPVASTKAMCPPGSISEKFLAQFEWVRSYILTDGHLFLATMADGSIIEFEPAGEVAATVFGEDIRSRDSDELQEIVLTRLFDRYAADQNIEAEPAEIGAFLERMHRGKAEMGLTADSDLTKEEAEQVATIARDLARSMIRQWKINRALYEEYGGRIIYQQLGPEPLDAYRQFLEKQQRVGALLIRDKSLEDGFWRYFTDDAMHDFMEPGGQDEGRAFTIPPWEVEN